MTGFEWAMVGLTALSSIGWPIIGFLMTKADRDRSAMRDQMIHLDKCFDDLKVVFFSRTSTRDDLEKVRLEILNTMATRFTEFNGTLSRMREAISNETHGLHERVFRLEDRRD